MPDVKIVLNHLGGPLGVGPYKHDEVFPGWRVRLCRDRLFARLRGQRQRRQNSPPRLAWRIFLEWRCRDRLLD